MLLDPEWVDACSVEGKADLYRPGDKVFFFMDDVQKEKQVPPQTPAILSKKQLPFT